MGRGGASPGAVWALGRLGLLLPHAWVEAMGRPLCQMERLRLVQGMTLPRALGLAAWWAGSRRGRAEAGRWPPWACSEPLTVCRVPGTPGPCWQAVCRVVGKMHGVLLAPGRAPLAQGWDCHGQWALTAPPSSHLRSQNANFQNPRCENTPLIGRESPPPSVSLGAGGWVGAPPRRLVSAVVFTGSAGPARGPEPSVPGLSVGPSQGSQAGIWPV